MPVFREQLCEGDSSGIVRLVSNTGFFAEHEVTIAAELVSENLYKGAEQSGYHFLLLEEGDSLLGYACYGRIACTLSRYDLYWIVVDKLLQGRGHGKVILAEVERKIRAHDGQRIYIETSSRPLYRSTCQFYQACHYHLETTLKDFYSDGDDKLIYIKKL